MITKSRPLFSNSLVFVVLSIMIILFLLFSNTSNSWIGSLLICAFLIFILTYLILKSRKITIDESQISIGTTNYLLPEDLKTYKIKNETFSLKAVKFNYQILVLYFKNKEVVIVSSWSYANYSEIKEALLAILETSDS